MKTTGKIGISAFLLVEMLVTSCMHYYYVANEQNVPLFKEKNELHMTGTFSLGDESESFEVQSAFSITDKLGIMANMMSTRGGIISNHNYGEGYYFDGGIGYFHPIGDKFVFEAYGGLGRSHQEHEYSTFRYDEATGVWGTFTEGKSELAFTKLFIQPAFGFTSKYLDVAFSARLCRLSYDIINNDITLNNEWHFDLNQLSNKSHFFIEPALTVRGGWKYIKAQFQVSASTYLNNSGYSFGEEFHLSFGLYFTIANRYKKNATD